MDWHISLAGQYPCSRPRSCSDHWFWNIVADRRQRIYNCNSKECTLCGTWVDASWRKCWDCNWRGDPRARGSPHICEWHLQFSHSPPSGQYKTPSFCSSKSHNPVFLFAVQLFDGHDPSTQRGMPYNHITYRDAYDIGLATRVNRGEMGERPQRHLYEPMFDQHWNILQACWHWDPSSRPGAEEVLRRLWTSRSLVIL